MRKASSQPEVDVPRRSGDLPYLYFAVAAVLFAAGALYLTNGELAAGSVYPPYSSLRADRDGSKLLFDALARLPGMAVDRNFLPLVFERTERQFHGVMPYRDGRPLGWSHSLV